MKSFLSSLQRDWESWSPVERFVAVGFVTAAPVASLAFLLTL
ncbi:hypothetical protein [Azospirillum formosense]